MIKSGNVVLRTSENKLLIVTGATEDHINTFDFDGNFHQIPIELISNYLHFTCLKDALGSALDVQHGGDHYKKLGKYQPWEVLKAWLTEEEFRGFMKGTAIAYLAREKEKGGDLDIQKATHTLQAFLEFLKVGD